MRKLTDSFVMSIEWTIQRMGLVEPGRALVAAVSGGADSVALVRVLAALAPRHGWRVSVCHVHHRLRGAAADEDLDFVRRLSEELGLPFDAKVIPPDFRECDDSGSLEAALRRARYRALREAASARGATVVATGHHRDDLAETVLWNLLRGCGTDGLRGMMPRAQIYGVVVVRPLIECSREDIRAWLSLHGWAWREDETNRDLARPRNRLRHQIIPLLRETLQPDVTDVLVRLSRFAGEDAAYLENEADRLFHRVASKIGPQLWRIDLACLRGGPVALLRRVARRILRVSSTDDTGGPPAPGGNETSVFLDWLMDGEPGSMFRWKGGMCAYHDYGLAYFFSTRLPRQTGKDRILHELADRLWEAGAMRSLAPFTVRPVSDQLTLSTRSLSARRIVELVWNQLRWEFRWVQGAGLEGSERHCCPSPTVRKGRLPAGPSACATFPAALVGQSLVLRFRRPGDRMLRENGRPGKKLKTVLINYKIPLVARNRIPVLATDRGVLWSPALPVDVCPIIRPDAPAADFGRWPSDAVSITVTPA